MNKNIILTILSFLGLYLFATGTSYAIFSFVVTPPNILNPGGQQTQQTQQTQQAQNSDLKALIDNSGPKTEVCPMNGVKYSVTEKTAWEKKRPLMVMIENHEEARPQSGLSSADIVYETLAEGGITRFMGVFYCDAQAYEVIVGPIRSARTYFLDWASEYGDYPLYTHVGGAHCEATTGEGCANGAKADALGQIDKYGWGIYNDLNQFSIGYPTFWRDYERIGHTVATEHTMYSTTERLWNYAAKERGLTNVDEEGNSWDKEFVAWKFNDTAVTKGDIKTVYYNFWENSPAGDYSVSWAYDPNNNVYARSNAGKEHQDLNKKQTITVTNVILMYSQESSANDGYANNAHLLYGTIGNGKAVWFHDGQAEQITWAKKSRTARTKFYDKNNQEINFTPGKIWISNVAIGNKSLDYGQKTAQ
ncbi:DUF3048 domain-containing protein [Candidatus Beckwithbacteria bacterium]|nr:DUF3048 domain-containing protein [Candidatus Beckwithbacteria bacterium]